ncbi:ribonuclease H-like domain-containing protein [Jackrogersella minutella]|nr:ribonuclease H-like domain-containing protein [Jackrogersella minutella]
MVYIMEFYVDGGCRRNGQSDAIGAAAACLMSRNGRVQATRTRNLDTEEYNATSQRAEILAMIIALEWAIEKHDSFHGNPDMAVTIRSDSRYAVGCMSDWIYKWHENGWYNARGVEVANRDLIEEASDLDDRVYDLGEIKYIYVPRAQNQDADEACNDALDEQEQSTSGSGSSPSDTSSSDSSSFYGYYA